MGFSEGGGHSDPPNRVLRKASQWVVGWVPARGPPNRGSMIPDSYYQDFTGLAALSEAPGGCQELKHGRIGLQEVEQRRFNRVLIKLYYDCDVFY